MNKKKVYKEFYYEGWNARVRGEGYDKDAGYEWRCGWLDCDEAPKEDQVKI